MGNILGQPFAPWVTKQINVRQQSLGYVDYNTDDLLYQNTKTPWIRLASSVDIVASPEKDGVLEKFRKIGVPQNAMQGKNAARNFILQGGAVGLDKDGNPITYQGLNTTTPPVSQFYKGAYGWGETTERGFVPLPGIIDASLVYYNNGALSKAVINMKCFSRNQLALMDALYMRPGYNLLLEFGWTCWLDNNTNKLTTFDTFQSPALSFMLGKNPTGTDDNPSNFEIPRLIQSERKRTYGNYEGVFGKITNFNWSFETDGSYACQTTLTGMGGVIESLKINGATYTKKDKENIKALESTASGEVEEGFFYDSSPSEEDQEKAQTALNAIRLKTELDDKIDSIYQSFKDRLDFKTDKKTQYGYLDFVYKSFPDPQDNFKSKKLVLKKAMVGFDGVDTDNEENLDPVAYMSFAFFLTIIQKSFLIYNESGKPYFTFDMDFFNIEKDDNYIINIPGQFSSNPFVCYTPYNNVPTAEGLQFNVDIPESTMSTIFNKVKNNFIVESGISQYLGRLAYVYLNFQFVKKCLSQAKRDPNDNSLALLPFIKAILAGVSKARGGINNILVHEDINTNSIKFLEEVPQNWSGAIPPKSNADTYCKINTFGVKNKVEGSIVRNIDLNASISKEFANMISIGAQSNGNQLNENATAFSKYNKGLVDRTFKQKITNPKNIEDTSSTEEEKEKKTIGTLWNENMQDVTDDSKGLFYNIMTDLKWMTKNVISLESSNVTFLKMLQGLLTNKNVIQSPFFLPFNLSLDIDGISGIKLYQKFTIDDNVLPPSYDKDSVDLQIKAANHTVSATDWVTKIETQSVPRSGEIKIAKIKKSSPPEPEPVATTYTQEEPEVQDDQVTITSQFPLENIFYPTETPKSQIYIHHTAGNQNIKRTIEIWNTRTDRVSTHYITNNNGDAEQLYVDEYWANHLGVRGSTFRSLKIPYRNLNKYSLGIELSAFGGVTLKDGVYKTIYNSTLPESEVAQPVNDNGDPITYKGYKYYQKYSNAQIANVKNIVTGWMNKYNIPFNYNWDELFNPNSLSKKALKGEKGVYTHNSVRTGKQDVFPQKELIDMFKSIADNIVTPPPSNTIVWEVLYSNAEVFPRNYGTVTYPDRYVADIQLRGTLNGESFEWYESGTFEQNNQFATAQEAIDYVTNICKEEIVIDGDLDGNNDWINAENSVPIP